jgi:diaminohydroxyphosphoribosylaminopyrimidine deaminase/5-amino-6-(5-phosphoribosylamino)uracil reductase
VGCLIIKNDRIISIGQTGFNGRPHAEKNAIDNSFQNLKGSKMYVSLEPCNHYGKTPPCTKSIIKSGIKELFYSINDIDKKVKGKSYKILSRKNIKVKKGLLNKEALDVYDSYIINRKLKLPYVTAKIAISKNKLIYSEGIKRITSEASDKISHFLRFKNDAIMISSKTLNIDNPKLNCRLEGFEGFSPKRIILDRDLDINLNTYIFRSTKKNNTIIFHNSLNKPKIRVLEKKGIILSRIKLNDKKKLDLKTVLRKLFFLGIGNLLVEGGDQLTRNMLNHKLIDRFYLFKSPKILSKNKDHVSFSSSDILRKKYRIKSKIISNLAKDNITIYKR